jgi:hypothetical protein
LTIPVLGNGAILAEFGPHVKLTSIVQMVLSIATILITSSVLVAPDVPSCLAETFAIVLNDIELHANGRVIGLDVAVTRRWSTLRGNSVEVVVHTRLGSTDVHVEFNVTTEEVP